MGRMDRFIQTSQNGIIMYNMEQTADMKEQFECARPHSFQEKLDLNTLIHLEDVILRDMIFQEDFKRISDELENDLKLDKNNFKTAWASAKRSFDGNPSKYRDGLKMNRGKDFPDACHIALICYTMEHATKYFGIWPGQAGIYPTFNRDCRSVCQGSLEFSQIANKSLFFLIHYVMENKNESCGGAIPTQLYRGCSRKFTIKDKGEILSFGQFTSTTARRGPANYFATPFGTIFMINYAGGKYVKTPVTNMKYHSYFPSEDEYLLSPFQLYRITNVEQTWFQTAVHLDAI